MKLSDLKDRVYIINLPNRTDRKEKLLREGTLGYFPNYKFFDAIKLKNVYSNKYSSMGALGCTLSHRSIVTHLKLSDYDFGLICEDDIEFNVTKDILEEYLNNIPDDWDIVSIGRECIQEIYSNVPTKYEMKNKYFYKYISGEVWGTQCYLIRNTVYDKLIKKFDNYGEKESIADTAIYSNEFNSYVSNYSLVRQMKDFSDNHGSIREIMSGRWRNDFGFY